MKIRKLLSIFCLSFVLLTTLGFTVSNAIQVKKDTVSADMDFDGKKENIILEYSEQMEILKALNLKVGKTTLSLKDYNIYGSDFGIDVVDINTKDKQKEILFSHFIDGDSNVEVFSYKNSKIVHIGTIEKSISIPAVNKKLNQLEVQSSAYFDSYVNYVKKYKIIDGKLKETTTDERNISLYDGKKSKPWEVIFKKSLKTYTDKKFTKQSFTINPKDKLTILSANQKELYLKVKNSKGQIGYIPMIIEEYSSYENEFLLPLRFKEYPQIGSSPEMPMFDIIETIISY